MSLQTRLTDLVTAVGADIKSLRTRVTTLETTPIGSIAQEGWHTVGAVGEPVFQNGWVPQQAVRFRKDPAGQVYLDGAVKSGTIGAVPAFTLPVGYRPSQNVRTIIWTWNGTTRLMGTADVNTNGEVWISSGSQFEAWLSAITFATDQATWPSGPIGPKGDTGATGPAATDAIPIEQWRIVGAGGEPIFAGGWINYGSGYPTAAFKKYPDGTVRLRGLVKNGTNGQPIFTLPVGYRPVDPTTGGQLIFPTVALSAFGEIRIGIDGTVVCQSGANGFVSLDGIEFDTGKTAWPVGPKGDPGPAGTTGAIIPVVTTLPSSPYDGQEIYFQNSQLAAEGIFWHLRYDATFFWAYKWVFMGGGTLFARGAKQSWNDRSVPNNTANQYLDGGAPQIRIPLAGTYDVEGSVIGVTSNSTAAPGFWLGKTTSTDVNWPAAEAATSVAAGNISTFPMSSRNRIDYAANDLAAMWYTNANIGGAVSFYNARMGIRPHRVG